MINHIAFIMDGNRRYANKQGMNKKDGYQKGMEKFLEIVSLQVKYKISMTTFFALSSDNYQKRPESDKEALTDLIKMFYENDKIKSFFIENKIHISIKGDLDEIEKKEKTLFQRKKFPIKELKEELKKWNEENKSHDFFVNLAINYDGQKEIVHAVKRIAKDISNGDLKINSISEKTIKKNLWFTEKEPEIIVRCGDAPRISGFMLWDSQYSEIYLMKKLWPEFDEADFVSIMNWFRTISRNFGK